MKYQNYVRQKIRDHVTVEVQKMLVILARMTSIFQHRKLRGHEVFQFFDASSSGSPEGRN